VRISEPLFTGVLAHDSDFVTHNFFSSEQTIKKAQKFEGFCVPKYAPSSDYLAGFNYKFISDLFAQDVKPFCR